MIYSNVRYYQLKLLNLMLILIMIFTTNRMSLKKMKNLLKMSNLMMNLQRLIRARMKKVKRTILMKNGERNVNKLKKKTINWLKKEYLRSSFNNLLKLMKSIPQYLINRSLNSILSWMRRDAQQIFIGKGTFYFSQVILKSLIITNLIY